MRAVGKRLVQHTKDDDDEGKKKKSIDQHKALSRRASINRPSARPMVRTLLPEGSTESWKLKREAINKQTGQKQMTWAIDVKQPGTETQL
jgi:hypothetical protein